MPSSMNHAETFRRLHAGAKPLLLANAWDAGSARLIERCGAAAIATTSAGLAWSRGYPDGDALPPRILAAALAEGRYDAMLDRSAQYAEHNELFSASGPGGTVA